MPTDLTLHGRRIGTVFDALGKEGERHHLLGRLGSVAKSRARDRVHRRCPIGDLSARLRGLEARREELAAEELSEREPLTDEDLALLQPEVREIIEHGDPPMRKALLQSPVDEIRVVSRAKSFPSFSLSAVRPQQRAVPLPGFEPGFPD